MSEPVLPDRPESDDDAAWGEAEEVDPQERLRAERPPHHDRGE